MAQKALLLINVGTPEAPTEEKVRVYLREFLMDPEVIDLPFPFRWLLVNGAILPKRPAESAKAYRKVWTDKGSPLLAYSEELTAKVQIQMDRAQPGQWLVKTAMRYGQPSIENVLKDCAKAGISEVVALPMYPQYSLAATRSAVTELQRAAKAVLPKASLRIMPAFYESASFIEAFADVARQSLQGYEFDHLLFSFHGLPERQVKKTDRSGKHCLSDKSCCDKIVDTNQDCYRAQCYATAHALARTLGLPQGKYTVCFQSRLGKTPWIQPHTDVLYESLPRQGIKKLAVMCPAFVADCLETLEEVQIRGKEAFVAQGGQDLRLVPSLNASDLWARAVAGMVQ